MRIRTGVLWIVGVLAILALVAGIFFRSWIAVLWTRVSFGVSDFFRDFGLTSPEDVTRIDDLRYGEDEMQVLDIYYPAGTAEALPTIVSIHGGGFVYGDKERYQYYCMSLAQRGFTVVNFSYRLAPEHKYPAALEDVNSVMDYICAHAREYFIDTDNVFFVGDSAGAQLNFQYTVAVTNPEYAELLGFEIPEFALRAVALNCGIYEPKDMNANIQDYYLGNLPIAEGGELDVLRFVTADFPPAYVMKATGDALAGAYTEPLVESLTGAGVVNELHVYGDDKIKPPHVFHLNMKSDLAAQCNDEECAFFRKYIATE